MDIDLSNIENIVRQWQKHNYNQYILIYNILQNEFIIHPLNSFNPRCITYYEFSKNAIEVWRNIQDNYTQLNKITSTNTYYYHILLCYTFINNINKSTTIRCELIIYTPYNLAETANSAESISPFSSNAQVQHLSKVDLNTHTHKPDLYIVYKIAINNCHMIINRLDILKTNAAFLKYYCEIKNKYKNKINNELSQYLKACSDKTSYTINYDPELYIMFTILDQYYMEIKNLNYKRDCTHAEICAKFAEIYARYSNTYSVVSP